MLKKLESKASLISQTQNKIKKETFMATTLISSPKTVIDTNIQSKAVNLKQQLNQSQSDAAVIQMYLTAIQTKTILGRT